MPRVILGKGHPPTSGDLPEKIGGGEGLLLPGQPKRITEAELQYVQEKFPSLTIHVLPKKPSEVTSGQKKRKPAAKPADTEKASDEFSAADTDGKSEEGDGNGESKKKSRFSRK